MTFNEIPPLYRHVWATYSAFRCLGFTDDEVTYESAPTLSALNSITSEDYIHVVLNAQCRRFTVTVDKLDRPFAEARTMLEKLRLAMRDGLVSPDDGHRIWRESKFGSLEYFTQFTFALMEHGFVLPALSQRQTN